MILPRRAVLRISWLSVSTRASTSLVTVGFTNDSGICWRSTRMTAFAVHRLGRNSATDVTAASTNRKGSTARVRRRRTVSMMLASPTVRVVSEPGCVLTHHSSGDDHHVARPQDDVLLVAPVADR